MEVREESIRQYCRLLRLPTIGAQFTRTAEEALKKHYSPVRISRHEPGKADTPWGIGKA